MCYFCTDFRNSLLSLTFPFGIFLKKLQPGLLCNDYVSHTQLKPFYRSFFEIRFLLIIDLIHVDSTRTKFGIIWSTETPANGSI